MRYSYFIAASGLLASVSGHGLVTSIQGANGVSMPGLSRKIPSNSRPTANIMKRIILTSPSQVIDGTPRDCITPGCGAEADTSIIRNKELGTSKASALGRTNGGGPIDAAAMIASFMGGADAASANTSSTAASADSAKSTKANKKNNSVARALGGLLSGLTGGGSKNQGTKSTEAQETSVAAAAGKGASSGLPTCADDGSITLTYRQINQDGAGPLTADVDGTSGGTDVSAFKSAEVTQDVPGLPAGGLSLATNTDFPVTVQMPAGMTCDASVGGADNVCIVRVRNGALAGPFGGSAAFTQSTAAKKRAIEYRLKKRAEEEKNQYRRLR
ncbi:cell surface protein [Xylariaceae sp. FL1651]|nr:cell surface protein [Xylariaceae sp. FL1651]